MNLTFLQGMRKKYFYVKERGPRMQQLGNTLFAVKASGKKFTLCGYALPDKYGGSMLLRQELNQELPSVAIKEGKICICHSLNGIYITYLTCFHAESFHRQHFSGNDEDRKKQLKGVCCAEANEFSKVLCLSHFI